MVSSVHGNAHTCAWVQVRSQTIHLLHVSRQGHLLVAHKLGKYIQDDDELLLARHDEAQAAWNAAHQQVDTPPPRSIG